MNGRRLFSIIALGAVLVSGGTVQAAEWRYCLSVNSAEKKVYVTQPFASDETTVALAEAFDDALSRSAIAHGGCQCPRSEAEKIARQNRQDAIGYNRQKGIEPVAITWPPER
jgi:hypothetical protein